MFRSPFISPLVSSGPEAPLETKGEIKGDLNTYKCEIRVNLKVKGMVKA
jgi:hypothetical protein